MAYSVEHRIVPGRPSEDLQEGTCRDELCNLFARADKHLENKNWPVAIEYAEAAVKLAIKQFDNRRKGCAYIRQAEAYRGEEHGREAIKYYRLAEKAFDDGMNSHNLAITWAYLVEVYQANKQWNQVIRYGQRARDELDQLANEGHQVGKTLEADRYKKWQQNVQQALDEAFKHIEPAPCPSYWAEFTQLPVLKEAIPAGAPIDLSNLAHNNIAAFQFIIHDKLYEIKSLLKNPRVLFTSGHSYAVVPVTGKSLNLLDILEDDYVVLHLLEGESPANNDIVAVEMKGAEEVMLKQYFIKDGKTFLRAQSSDSAWKDYRVRFDDTMQIRGIAIAILKPASER